MDVEVGLCWLGGGGEWIKWILGVELCGEGEEVYAGVNRKSVDDVSFFCFFGGVLCVFFFF